MSDWQPKAKTYKPYDPLVFVERRHPDGTRSIALVRRSSTGPRLWPGLFMGPTT
jgi:hypothetical protein